MRILITGSRAWTDRNRMLAALDEYMKKGHEWCHGAARGADTLADELLAEEPVTAYPAQWDIEGRAAGPKRNQHMLDDFAPDLVIAFPLAGSVGTWDMVRRAVKAGVEVRIVKEK